MSQSERQVAAQPSDSRVQELRASAHLMTFDTGTFCLVNGSTKPSGDVIAGVRVSSTEPTDPNVSIASFRPDGWLGGGGDSALIRVLSGPAQIMITIYQPIGVSDSAPKLRVLRLSDPTPAAEATDAPAPVAKRPVMILTEPHDIVAHVQRTGDIGRAFGEWVGAPGSQMAIEGFSMTAPQDLAPGDLSYQAVLGRGWLSPWAESGQFCGSRGMALPILGLKVRLSDAAAKIYDLRYAASFIDGTKLDDLHSEDSCETPSLAPLEAMRVELVRKATAKAKAPAEAPPAAAKPAVAKAAPPKAAAPKAAEPAKPAPQAAKGSKARTR
jgi:hypothetical protein